MMQLQHYLHLVTFMIIIHESLAFSAIEDHHIKNFIGARKLREAGFNEIELTSFRNVHGDNQLSLDASSINRRRRSVGSFGSYDVEFTAFGESYKMSLYHMESILHTDAKILTINDDTEEEWNGEHPDCFLNGDLYSHNGSVSASFCDELAGMMLTNNHEIHFEVLPHHIRQRSILTKHAYSTLISRRARANSRLAGLNVAEDYVNTNIDQGVKESRQKRTVPSHDFTIEIAVYCDEDFLLNYLPVVTITERVTAMIVKYNAVAMEWGRSDALGYNVTLSLKLMAFFDKNPLWYNTSTDLGVPLSNICDGTKLGPAYDHVHVHTGVKNPTLGGVAYQSQVCNSNLRCGVSADGLYSYVTTAHELGHNMGMYHDSDRNCISPDIGNMGGAGVGWSTCSANDMNTMLQTGNHNCLWQDNVLSNQISPATLQSVTLQMELPGQMMTNDEICEMLHGSGFRYREYPQVVPTTCNIFSCVNHNVGNYYGLMYRHSDMIAGSYCAPNKICFRSACQVWSAAKLSNLEIRSGGWSAWGSWTTTCSRTCGRGMLFRRRKCNNPTPKNSATCDGNEHDAAGCNLQPCAGDSPFDSVLISQRASESCAYLIKNNIINGSLYTSVGQKYYGSGNGMCEVSCNPVTGYSTPSWTRFGLIEHGTPCSGTLSDADTNNYSRRPGFYWACLEGYCEKFDCANTLNGGVFDGCGVCNGNNDTCLIRQGSNNDTITIWTRIDWITIPVGAYNIELSYVWANNPKYYIEIYTKENVAIIASSTQRVFVTGANPVSYGGALWNFDSYKQIMHAKGPLTLPVYAKIYNYGTNAQNTGVNYIYSVPLNINTCTGTCANGGTFSASMCACSCRTGYSGLTCTSTCTSSTLCKNGASVNESTCGCICNEKQYGPQCDCRYPFTGGNCNTCKFYTCQNCGVFNTSTCRCECPAGYGGLQCEKNCADYNATCVDMAAAGKCISDNVYMEANCEASCNLCVVQAIKAACPPVSTSLQCTNSNIACTADSTCISLSKKCDGVNDCSDGSDETCSWLRSNGNSLHLGYGSLILLLVTLGFPMTYCLRF